MWGAPVSKPVKTIEISKPRIDLSKPRYDQETFEGRARHFFITTNPLNVLASDAELENAKSIVDAYRAGEEDKSLTEDQIWTAKELYDSAFHPQTGEKLFLPGRMSFQVRDGNLISLLCLKIKLNLQFFQLMSRFLVTWLLLVA